MYCINVTYTACDGQSIRDFYNEIRKMRIAEITRQEAGNLGYEYYFSADRENENLLLEKWESKEHQQKHACKPHLSQLGKIKEKYGIISSVEEIG